MNRQNAFTLVELMIVIAIVGILVTAIAPGMRSFVANSASNSLSSTLLIEIMYARNHAISNGVIVKMVPIGIDPAGVNNNGVGNSDFTPNSAGVNWGFGWITFVDSNDNILLNDNDILDPGEFILRTHASFGPGAHISSGPGDQYDDALGNPQGPVGLLDRANPIGFMPSGAAIRSGALTIATFGCAGTNARTIQINQIGQVIGRDILCPQAFTDL